MTKELIKQKIVSLVMEAAFSDDEDDNTQPTFFTSIWSINKSSTPACSVIPGIILFLTQYG